MRKPLVLTSLAVSLLFAGCDSPSAIGDHSLIHAEARAATLTVSNVGRRPVHYAVFERVDEGTIFWGKCTPANDECPTLAPGESVRIPYAQIARYDEGDTEAIVFWWEVEPDGAGGYRITREGSLIVQL